MKTLWILTLVLTVFISCAKTAWATQSIVRLDDLESAWTEVQKTNGGAQAVLKFIRLQRIAMKQLKACEKMQNIKYVLHRVSYLKAHLSSETEFQELSDWITQLDQSGCCLYLPEAQIYNKF